MQYIYVNASNAFFFNRLPKIRIFVKFSALAIRVYEYFLQTLEYQREKPKMFVARRHISLGTNDLTLKFSTQNDRALPKERFFFARRPEQGRQIINT